MSTRLIFKQSTGKSPYTKKESRIIGKKKWKANLVDRSGAGIRKKHTATPMAIPVPMIARRNLFGLLVWTQFRQSKSYSEYEVPNTMPQGKNIIEVYMKL